MVNEGFPSYRLGRHINHDERSKNFVAPMATSLKTISHRHYGPALNQNPVGACTGFSGADWLNCLPEHKVRTRLYDNNDGFTFYSEATKIDPWQGEWDYPPPPGKGQDTGSDGLSVCKVMKNLGLIAGYDHAFGLDQTLKALMLSPVMIGVNWYEGFDTPNAYAIVSKTGQIRGGHEVCLTGYIAKQHLVKALNHWGPDYGMHGFFYFPVEVLGELLDNEQGDCTVPRVA